MQKLTWLEIVNLIFAAHRSGDVVQKQILMDLLDDTEPNFADQLDAIQYSW